MKAITQTATIKPKSTIVNYSTDDELVADLREWIKDEYDNLLTLESFIARLNYLWAEEGFNLDSLDSSSFIKYVCRWIKKLPSGKVPKLLV
jgi:hypothetical protein